MQSPNVKSKCVQLTHTEKHRKQNRKLFQGQQFNNENGHILFLPKMMENLGIFKKLDVHKMDKIKINFLVHLCTALSR